MKKFFYQIIVLVFVLINWASAQESIKSFNASIIVTDDVSPAKTLVLGLDPAATDEIDLSLGESELPPMPPSGNFEARFILPTGNFNGSLNSWTDIRNADANPYTGQKVYRLHFQKTAAATYIIVKWNLPANVTGTLKDIVSGTLINVAVSGAGEYKVTNPAAFNKLSLTLDFNAVSLAVDKDIAAVDKFQIIGNYPNPFNPSTKIAYFLPEKSEIVLNIYSSTMEHIETIHTGMQEAGGHSVSWNGSGCSSGVYFYSIQYQKNLHVGKMLLLK